MSENNKVVNLDDLNDLARGNTAFIREMIGLFLEQNPMDLNELDAALDKSDLPTVRVVAHRMKTSVGFMGMKQLLAPLSEMEKLAESKAGVQEIAGIYAKVKHDCGLATAELQGVLGSLDK